MYADRYERAKPNPVSLTAAIGVNAALVAALLLSVPEFRKIADAPFEAYSLPDDPVPPPEPQPQPQPDMKLRPQPRIVTPKPEILPPVPSDDVVESSLDPQPYLPPAPGVSGGGSGMAVDPPKPAPVLVDAAPDPRAVFQPDYPPSERRAGVEGSVTVRVLIGTDGRVKAVEQVRSVGDAFFAATRRQALSRWRFTPATRDGVPYESWRTMTVRFVLE